VLELYVARGIWGMSLPCRKWETLRNYKTYRRYHFFLLRLSPDWFHNLVKANFIVADPVLAYDEAVVFLEVQLSVARITSNPVAVVNVDEKIRSRAYQLFEQRGYQHGHDLDDWLQAEAELLRSKMEPPAVKAAITASPAAIPTLVKPAAKRTSTKRSTT